MRLRTRSELALLNDSSQLQLLEPQLVYLKVFDPTLPMRSERKLRHKIRRTQH
jgi:hypothetical protein